VTTPPNDPVTPQADPATPVVDPATPPVTPPADPATPPVTPEPEADAEGKDEDLPEWARKKLTKTNAEAANYRTRLREAEDKLSQAKTPQEFEAAIADFKAKNAELEQQVARATAARKFDLPDELAALVQGDTPEAMAEHAKTLSKFAQPAAPESLGGGLDPTGTTEEFDPVAQSRKARRRY